MPEFPSGIDPEAAGSRFSNRVAIAVLTRPGGNSRFDERGDTGDADAVASEALEGVSTEALGQRQVLEGSYGRGASSWVPVVEWTAVMVGSGVLQGAAWEGVKLAARELRSLLDRLRNRGVKTAISRGAAAHVAVGHVIERTDEAGILDVEAVEEPSASGGRHVTELSYVAFEPWLVSVLNEKRTTRYVVAVSPDGEILDSMSLPISDAERFYMMPAPRDL